MFIIIMIIILGTVTLDEPLEYDHFLQSFLEQSDIDAADPPMSGASPWWEGGGVIAPEVGLLSHSIVIQGEWQNCNMMS